MAVASSAALPSAPHLLFVLVDDLGHGNVGFHRAQGDHPPEVATPNMDALVKDGAMLNRHYVYKMCTPSRSSFISGRLPVHVTQKLKDPEAPNCGVPRNMTGIAHVLKKAGYATHQVGKWDAGMSTPHHTPQGRGFDTSLGYFEHKNDFWSKGIMQSKCLNAGNGTYGNLTDLWDTDKPAPITAEYEEELFRDRVVSIVRKHPSPDTTPLFVLYTPHVAHCPLQAPEANIDRFAALTGGTDEGLCHAQTNPGFCPLCKGPTPTWPQHKQYPCRAIYASMVNFLDGALGSITGEMRARGMYDHSLIVLSSDNGGPIGMQESASTNHPLRGGKYSELEGGVRATAFMSGGFVPAALRGTTSQVVLHVADWYATFAALANLPYPTDHAAAASGLPPLDSVNAWPALTGQAAPYTHEYLPLSASALLDAKTGLKLLRGTQKPSGWQGSSYPNASSHTHDPSALHLVCSQDGAAGVGGGCLFNVSSDPHEVTDLAFDMPAELDRLSAKLDEMAKGFFENSDVGVDACPTTIPADVPCACWMARHKYGGTMGPFQEIEVT